MISAKIVADSISSEDIRLTTMELNYPRFIHSELMTHRMFSRNAASSRAIPIEKMIKQVEENPAMPIHWGKNQPGMQAREECTTCIKLKTSAGWDKNYSSEDTWKIARDKAVLIAEKYNEAGYHKQIVNRLLEPFQWMKVIVTATEWDNFFNLRLHEDAQPEIAFLAAEMRKAMDESTPVELKPGEWHLPYVESRRYFDGTLHYGVERYDNPHDNTSFFDEYSLEGAIKCSVANCAKISYDNHGKDSTIEKNITLADRLLAAGHMSPFEHIATPMQISNGCSEGGMYPLEFDEWEDGVTHLDKIGRLWSGNFRGWIQYRQLL